MGLEGDTLDMASVSLSEFPLLLGNFLGKPCPKHT